MAVELDVRQPVVLRPGPGEKLLSDQVTVVEFSGEASAAPHIHRAHVDAFYVVEGELEFAGMPVTAASLGYATPEVVHWFVANSGRFLNIHAPGAAWTRRMRARHERRRPSDDEIDTYSPPDGAAHTATVVRRDEGERLTNEQRTIRIKIARPELCLFEFESYAGHTGPPPHIHRRHLDAFYVLEGELDFFVDGETTRGGPGTFVAAPPDVVHTFAVVGDGARFLNLHAPGTRYDEFFRRMAAGEHDREFQESFDQYYAD